MADFSNSVLGVTGASGYVGRAVIAALQARGAKRIVAVTRDPGKLAGLDGVHVRQGDFDRPDGLAAAFAGIDRLLIISADTIGKRVPQHVAAIDAAEAAGVGHLIYTSIATPYPHATHLVQNEHFWTEARLFATKSGWTSLRDNVYADLHLWELERTLASGKIFHAAGVGRRAIVTRDDIAAAAAGALLTAEGREIVDVTGPEALSYDDIAATLSRVTGKPVEAVAVTPDAQLAGMVGAGLPQALAEAFLGFDLATARGALAITGDGVRRFAGRDPQSLEAFLRGNLPG